MPAKKKSEDTDKLSIDALAAHINSQFGANTMVRASDSLASKVSYVSTGCTAIDLMLMGGLVEGRIHQFRGGFSSTKTTTLHRTAYEFLSKYDNGCYILVDAEGTSDVQFLRNILGFTDEMLTRIFFVSPDSGENAGDVAIEISKRAEKVFIGIDSVDALTPSSEQESDMDKAGVSPGARMMNKFMRKLIPVMKTDLLSDSPRCTMVMISQLREKIGVMFGDNSTTWGGKGKEFAAATILKFARTAWLREGDKKTGSVYGMALQIEAVKCKGPGHGEVAECDYYKANKDGYKPGEFDNVGALIRWGVRLKIIKKVGRKYEYKGNSYTCEKDLKEVLRKRGSMRNALQQAIIKTRHDTYYRN